LQSGSLAKGGKCSLRHLPASRIQGLQETSLTPYSNEYTVWKETSKDLRMNSDEQEQLPGRLDMARPFVLRTVAKIHPAKKQATGATVFNCTGTTTNIENTHNHPNSPSLYTQSSYNHTNTTSHCTSEPCTITQVTSHYNSHCTNRFRTMCQDHFIVYLCGHMQYLEFEACPLYQKALRKCKEGKETVVEHSSHHNCRECRSEDEKEARDQFRAENRGRFKYEV
jgi:hypothetical protein